MSNINWQTVGHVTVGILIAGSQATALGFPQDTTLVTICHIVAIVAAQAGVSLGVWTVSASVSAKKTLLAANCNNCGKPAFAGPAALPPVDDMKNAAEKNAAEPKAEPPKAP